MIFWFFDGVRFICVMRWSVWIMVFGFWWISIWVFYVMRLRIFFVVFMVVMWSCVFWIWFFFCSWIWFRFIGLFGLFFGVFVFFGVVLGKCVCFFRRIYMWDCVFLLFVFMIMIFYIRRCCKCCGMLGFKFLLWFMMSLSIVGIFLCIVRDVFFSFGMD